MSKQVSTEFVSRTNAYIKIPIFIKYWDRGNLWQRRLYNNIVLNFDKIAKFVQMLAGGVNLTQVTILKR